MKTAKQEAIEKAYGEHYNALQPYLDGDGWCFGSVKEINDIAFKFFYDENFQRNAKDKCWRPKSLSGLETNNGWIRIESEDDLPKEEGRYYTISNQGDDIVTMKYPVEKFDLEFNRQWWLKYITHYQKVTLPERPIY